MRSCLLDTSVLIGLLDKLNSHHVIAHQWLKDHLDHALVTCPLTELGFVRIVSSPAYINVQATPREAQGLLQTLKGKLNTLFWPDQSSLCDPTVFDFTHVQGHNQLTDVYLLALAVKQGGALVTFDHRIPRQAVRGATAENLVLLEI